MEFKWQNPQVEYNENGIISQVHYRLIGSENEISVECYGVVNLPEPKDKNIISFDEIDKEIIIKWIESILNVEELKKNILNQIGDIKKPKSFIKTIR